MSSNLPPVEHLLSWTDSWDMVNDNTFLATYCSPYGENIRVPFDYLKGIHPDFPAALKAAISWRVDEEKNPEVSGYHAHYTALLVKGELIRLELHNKAPLYFERIDKFSVNPSITDTVYVKGERLTVMSDTRGIQNIYFVVSCNNNTVGISREHLDVKYPDWEKRYRIASDLGLTDSEVAAHVLKKSSYLVAPAIDINFN